MHLIRTQALHHSQHWPSSAARYAASIIIIIIVLKLPIIQSNYIARHQSG